MNKDNEADDESIKSRRHFEDSLKNTENGSDDENKNVTEPITAQLSEDEQIKVLTQEKERLKKALQAKEESIRKMKLVKMYRAKHNLVELDALILKWRNAAQESAEELYRKFNDPKPEMAEFLVQLHVDQEMIRYNPDTEAFY